jgi:regulator of sirC expression with transglutaminase-like and TPR domain
MPDEPTPSVFQAALTAADGGVDLVRAAMALGAIAEPELDVDAAMREFEALADEVAAEAGRQPSLDAAVQRLNQALFVEREFHGNRDDYDDPRNSFLHEVITRRTGLPIALSVLYIAVGSRLGTPLAGVGFPGHFIVRAGNDDGAYRYVDPFNEGRELTRRDLAAFLARQGGDPERQLDVYLAAVTPRQILDRMLNNLKLLYARRQDYPHALATIELRVQLMPWSLEELRDRGLVHAQLGHDDAAADDLAAYLQAMPDAADAPRIRDLLQELRDRMG